MFFRWRNSTTIASAMIGAICLISLCALPIIDNSGWLSTPTPTKDAHYIQTIIVGTSAAAATQTIVAYFPGQSLASTITPTSTVTLIPLPASFVQDTTTPFLTFTPFAILIPYPTATQVIYELAPPLGGSGGSGGSSGSGGSGGGCCKHCTNSQACGNSCISWSYTCHKPPGCACP